MATIKVNSTVMRDKASSLKDISTKIKALTDEMTSEINRLKSTWEGDVAEGTVRKFQALNANFDEKYNTINSYASFLNEAADEWDRINSENTAEQSQLG